MTVVAEADQALRDFEAVSPPLRELRGTADIVHDVYTGIERIFEKVAPELNGGVPAGPAWHRELLENMTLELPGLRPQVISRQTASELEELLRFRHRFRNMYGFELEWPKLRPLLERLPATWKRVETEVDAFLAFLDAAGRG